MKGVSFSSIIHLLHLLDLILAAGTVYSMTKLSCIWHRTETFSLLSKWHLCLYCCIYCQCLKSLANRRKVSIARPNNSDSKPRHDLSISDNVDLSLLLLRGSEKIKCKNNVPRVRWGYSGNNTKGFQSFTVGTCKTVRDLQISPNILCCYCIFGTHSVR